MVCAISEVLTSLVWKQRATCDSDGIITDVRVDRGQVVAEGQVVARLIARHGSKWFGIDTEDYVDLDATLGKVKRISKLTTHERDAGYAGYLAYIVREHGGGCFDRPKRTGEDSAPFEFYPVLDYQRARFDVEFWQELEALSGRRERWARSLCSTLPS